MRAIPTKIQGMKQAFILLALSGAAACVAVADDVQSVSTALDAGLEEQLAILTGVKDAASASAAVTPLSANLAQLKALNDRVDATALWRYIENTPEVKQRLLQHLYLISIEFQRIQQAQFFAVAELKALLEPLLIPVVERPVEDAQE